MKTITVYYKNVYGNELCYPKCETAKKLAKLTNSKTFTHTHLNDIQSLGYEILVEAEHQRIKENFLDEAETRGFNRDHLSDRIEFVVVK
tara:strand:- start:814 stop:1080 length:267 start_codon:yes stop_codon:yes gene_type:complete